MRETEDELGKEHCIENKDRFGKKTGSGIRKDKTDWRQEVARRRFWGDVKDCANFLP